MDMVDCLDWDSTKVFGTNFLFAMVLLTAVAPRRSRRDQQERPGGESKKRLDDSPAGRPTAERPGGETRRRDQEDPSMTGTWQMAVSIRQTPLDLRCITCSPPLPAAPSSNPPPPQSLCDLLASQGHSCRKLSSMGQRSTQTARDTRGTLKQYSEKWWMDSSVLIPQQQYLYTGRF
ncbi:unnamed protein product [Gadus morhua 'NCC']